MAELLHVDGQDFDPDDLTYGEKREIRRLVRTEIWDEDMDGDFDWEEVGENEILPATILVFMRRTNPAYSMQEAMALKPRDVYDEEEPSNGVPPTGRVSAPRKTSAKSGSRT